MKQTIKTYKYKEDIALEYINTLGWVFIPKGSETCTVVYLPPNKRLEAIKMYERG